MSNVDCVLGDHFPGRRPRTTSRIGVGGRLIIDCHNVMEVPWTGSINAPVENGADDRGTPDYHLWHLFSPLRGHSAFALPSPDKQEPVCGRCAGLR